MTIHYESMRQLCVGADYQQGIANEAQKAAEELARQVDPAEERAKTLRRQAEAAEADLAAVRRQLADAQQQMMDHGQLAADFRHLAAEQCEANGWDLPDSTVPEPPHSAQQIIGKAVDDLAEPPHGVSLKCFKGLCKTDPQACEGCEHDCHWLPAEAEKPQEAEQTNPDPAPEPKAEARARTPWAPLLALYVRMQLAERGEGRHAGRWRIFKHRALIEVV